MILKKIAEISEADLQTLITNGVAEGRTIDYKQTLPGNADADKKDFLADVSSFANSSGGDLVFGIEESGGLPTALRGIGVGDLDLELQRLDSIIRQGLDPRIAYHIKAVSVTGGVHAIVLRIDRSWNGPHRVVFKGWDKFYSRNSAGKYPLDVDELRAAFTGGLAVAEKLRAFRADRIAAAINGDAPLSFTGDSKVLIHYLPFQAFTGMGTSLTLNQTNSFHVPLLAANQSGSRVNLEGLLVYAGADSSHSYTQLYRSGIIEAVSGTLLRTDNQGQKYIPYIALEHRVLQHAHKAIRMLHSLAVEPPIAIGLTLTNVKHFQMARDPMDFFDRASYPLREQNLVLPEVIVEDVGQSVTTLLKPIFDLIWNACGYLQSPDFDANANWINQKYPLNLNT